MNVSSKKKYRLDRRLGSGGMGDVYLAERADEEYNQVVAIKLVRAGAFTPQVQGRLRTERPVEQPAPKKEEA